MSIESKLKAITREVLSLREEVREVARKSKSQVIRIHEIGKDLQSIQENLKRVRDLIDSSQVDKARDLVISLRASLNSFESKKAEIRNV